jgi:N-acetyltransferase
MSRLAVTLVGRDVQLTPLAPEDVDDLLRAATEDRANYAFTLVPDSRSEMAAMISRQLDEQARGLGVPFTTRRSSGEVIGMTRFLTLRWWYGRDVPDAVEIGGTFLAASAQRTRANTEAKLLMLTHAFDVWGVQRVDLKTDARNERSRRAIERLGATFEGVLRQWQPSFVDGESGRARDSAMYSIVSNEWPEIDAALRRRLV